MNPLKSIANKVTEIRNANIERREAINRVKDAMRNKGADGKSVTVDDEAKKLSDELGVSYSDALEYVKSERKSKARREGLMKLGNSLHEIGEAAKEDNRRRAKAEGWGLG